MNLKQIGKNLDDAAEALVLGKRLSDVRASKSISNTVSGLLANDDVVGMIQNFIDEDMVDCHSLVIIQKSKDGRVTCHTNLPDLSLFGLVHLVMQNWDQEDAR